MKEDHASLKTPAYDSDMFKTYNLCKEIEQKTVTIDKELYLKIGDHLNLVKKLRDENKMLKDKIFKPQIIGLCGSAGAGKTTVAKILMDDYSFVRTRFAEPMKAMIRALLTFAGFEPNDIEQMVDGNLKEKAFPELNFKSPRFAMQTLGTEWGREYLGTDIWVDLTMRNVRELIHDVHASVVIDDVRFPNESKAIKKAGGKVLRVMRDHDPIPGADHKSETQLIEFDGCILNTGSIADLKLQIAQNL